jgi:hypothetical protein
MMGSGDDGQSLVAVSGDPAVSGALKIGFLAKEIRAFNDIQGRKPRIRIE